MPTVSPPVDIVEVALVDVALNHPMVRLPMVVDAEFVSPLTVRFVSESPVPCPWVKRRFWKVELADVEVAVSTPRLRVPMLDDAAVSDEVALIEGTVSDTPMALVNARF